MGSYDSRRVQKLCANKLKKALELPERRAQEDAFAFAHAGDSDGELYAYLVRLKKGRGRLKQADVIGCRYLTERLGPWPGIMTQVNLLLRNETETQ